MAAGEISGGEGVVENQLPSLMTREGKIVQGREFWESRYGKPDVESASRIEEVLRMDEFQESLRGLNEESQRRVKESIVLRNGHPDQLASIRALVAAHQSSARLSDHGPKAILEMLHMRHEEFAMLKAEIERIRKDLRENKKDQLYGSSDSRKQNQHPDLDDSDPKNPHPNDHGHRLAA